MQGSQGKKTEPTAEQKPQLIPAKPPLDRETLTDVVDLALWAGQLLMQNGAESERVEETVHRLGTGLGCDWGDVLVSYNAIIVTHISGGEFRTKIRRVTQGGVNMTVVAAISHLTHRVTEGKFDRFKVRAELERISSTPRHYNRWLTAFTVGLACAAFSRLFGGDWPTFGVTLVAAIGAMIVRQELAQRRFNILLTTLITAFIAGSLVGILNLLPIGSQPGIALAASALLLVPGAAFINSVEDLIKGHTVVGMARGVTGTLIILAIALGLLLAMRLTGVSGL
jgi:uncharacterized membrane protein YjjP (DUF1212 family)